MVKKSLLTNILLLLFGFMLIPLILLSSINYRMTYKQMYNNMVDATQDDTGNIAYYLMMELSEYMNLTYYIAQNKELKTGMAEYYEGTNTLENLHRQMLALASSPSISKRVKYPYDYFLILKDGEIVTRYNHSGVVDYSQAAAKIKNTGWYTALGGDTAEAVRIFQDLDYINVNGGEKIYIARNIPLPNNENAILVTGISRYLIDRLIDNYRPGKDSSIFVFTDGNLVAKGEQNVIQQKEAEDIYAELSKNNRITNGEFAAETKEDMLCNVKTFFLTDIPKQEWQIVVLTPTLTILKNIQYIKFTTIILIFLCVGGAVFLFFIAKKNIFDRIVLLKTAMLEVGKGTVLLQLPPGKDEIGDLYLGFNEMTCSLAAAKERAEAEEKERISLELTMLQAQITPHFVRNTLNSIRWMAEMLREDGIARSIVSLTRLLDYNIREFTHGVTFQEEFDNLHEYVNIEKLRFGNKFVYETQIDPRIFSQKTLKLLLQPVVENCILHGFNNLETIGRIRITGEVLQDNIVLGVADNGVGMSEEDMVHILHPEDESRCSRIGIYNVNKRIRYQYGEGYGLEIHKNEPQGICVEIRLPFIREVEKI